MTALLLIAILAILALVSFAEGIVLAGAFFSLLCIVLILAQFGLLDDILRS